MTTTIDNMTDDEITRLVATEVMRYRDHPEVTNTWLCNNGGFRPFYKFQPLTNANDDVMVLKVVKQGRVVNEIWFHEALERVWRNRFSVPAGEFRPVEDWPVYFQYETGDYARAAAMAVMENKE